MVPDLGKQGLRPYFGKFCYVSFLLILISADMSNASIMHTIVFLNILKPYFMTFFIFSLLKKTKVPDLGSDVPDLASIFGVSYRQCTSYYS